LYSVGEWGGRDKGLDDVIGDYTAIFSVHVDRCVMNVQPEMNFGALVQKSKGCVLVFIGTSCMLCAVIMVHSCYGSTVRNTILYDTIQEFNVDSNLES